MVSFALAVVLAAVPAIAGNALTSQAGQKAPIPNWDLQTSSIAKDLAAISKPGFDVSSWHHIPKSRCTLMGCLLEAGEYRDTELWYSENLKSFNWGQFSVPWVYRNEFALEPKKGQHYLLKTNGIASAADLYLNGKEFAKSDFQTGAFGGHTYDVTNLVAERNALAVQVYPSDFNYDLVQGFVDWNVRAPDNASGIWRDIVITQTGSVAMGPMSVFVDIKMPIEKNPATVTVRATAQNLEKDALEFQVSSIVSSPSSCSNKVFTKQQNIKLRPGESKMVEIQHIIQNPIVWWPKEWGKQPLYNSKLTFKVNNRISDENESKFGIRTVTSEVNAHNDTMFTVNGYPFQVRGGGYSPDHFFRWDRNRFTNIANYILDMGQNTVRLEGTLEQPELYEIADEMGIMVISGWVCCSKWESWDFNHDLDLNPPPLWDDGDYATANASMIHEGSMMQTHPSMLAFLVGSDFWPDDRATKIYVDDLKSVYWQTPIIASASKRGFPARLGPSGMKMDGPYDWVPPNYWFDVEGEEDRLGSSFGFGSELGPGVGTPEMGSLQQFLSKQDMEDLWKKPNKGLYHMSTNTSSFYNREIYNEGLFKRYGAPKSLEDYLLKAQIMDYEATRSQYEGYSAHWSSERPATGIIYWMLNNAWPSLHWNQFDHYMHPAGSYFGTKVGLRPEHVAYDNVKKTIWVINHTLDRKGSRKVALELMDLKGNVLQKQTISVNTKPNASVDGGKVNGLDKIKDVAFLRLVMTDEKNSVLSRNVYWTAPAVDELYWGNSTWYHTPVTKFVDFSPLLKMQTATVSATLLSKVHCDPNLGTYELVNTSPIPAFFVRLNLVDNSDNDVNPVYWSDNYVTLWPGEKLRVQVRFPAKTEAKVKISGVNIKAAEIPFKC